MAGVEEAMAEEFGGVDPLANDASYMTVPRDFARLPFEESLGRSRAFLASLRHAGLVALTHTPSPMAFLGSILERPRNERPYVVIPVGYPAADATVPTHAPEKKPLEQILIRK
jgi:hypothetical protein